MGVHQPMSGAERVALRRKRLRDLGLKSKQYWVYDADAPGFRERIAAAGRRIAASQENDEVMAFVEAVQYWPPDDPD
jgi:Protein  of unknown function (DUF3018)